MDKLNDSNIINIFNKLSNTSLVKYSNEIRITYLNIHNIDLLYAGRYVYLLSKDKNEFQDQLVIKYIIKKFNSKYVLDLSADQLIGALSTNIDLYVNNNHNNNLIKLLQPLNPHVKINTADKNTKFDLICINNIDFTKILDKLKNTGHIVVFLKELNGIGKKLSQSKIIPDLYYLGNMFFSDARLKIYHPIFIYEKNSHIPVNLYNPPISVSDFIHNKNTIHVIRDDYIIGGTKCRAVIQFIQSILKLHLHTTELIYLGASNGYAQIALAYGLQLLKSDIKLRLYAQIVPNLSDVKKLQSLTTYLYPNTTYIHLQKSFKDIWPLVDSHLELHPNTLLLPFGMDDIKFKNCLSESLTPHLETFINKIPRMWMVIGSGVLFSVLYAILVNTHFCLVQVGKEVDVSKYDPGRYTLYKSKSRLYEAVNAHIPYCTTKSYDGKIWEFESEFMSGDWIWNVAGIHQKI